MLVKRWKSGPLKEQPKVSTGVQSLIDRGLATLLDDGSSFPRARFTEAGLRALVAMAADPRAFQPPDPTPACSPKSRRSVAPRRKMPKAPDLYRRFPVCGAGASGDPCGSGAT